MKGEDIVFQLHKLLPKFTDAFTDDIAITSLTMAGTTVTLVSTSPHGLSTGDQIFIEGALAENPITSLTQLDDVASAVTSLDHDLTVDPNINNVVTVADATEPEYNGTLPLLTADPRTEFTYEISGDPSSPATGSPVLLESYDFGYNGLKVVTVIDPSTLTYESELALGTTARNAVGRAKIRIAGAFDIETSLRAYEKRGNKQLWGFVVLENVIASKDRSTRGDADASVGPGNDRRQQLIQNFSIYVFVPTAQNIAGRDQRDQMEDLTPSLFSSLLFFKPDSGLKGCPTNGVTFVSHQPELYDSGIYVHRFQFQTIFYLSTEDTIQPVTVAFRDIDLKFIDPLIDDGDNIIMEAKIELDN